MKTLNLGIEADAINSNTADATAGTEFAIPYYKGGISVAWQTLFTGTVTAISMALQVSMDGVNWTTIDSDTADTSGWYRVVANVIGRHIRVYHTSRTGGTNVKTTLLAF